MRSGSPLYEDDHAERWNENRRAPPIYLPIIPQDYCMTWNSYRYDQHLSSINKLGSKQNLPSHFLSLNIPIMVGYRFIFRVAVHNILSTLKFSAGGCSGLLHIGISALHRFRIKVCKCVKLILNWMINASHFRFW